ncbi:hypothetical protein DXG01_010338 [Tephrocybe rancida]|nr:hypothetical protein DXG01_010338 [Tephrocybe rancida]
MALKPLEIQKKGLKTLRKKIKAKKTKLETLLAKQKCISSEDEAWLDHEGNLVDLEKVVDKLETASDYDRDVERCKVVLDARQAAEDALINGGDDDVNDNADKPTNAFLRRDFLKLSISITSHLNGINIPTARRVEADLASIARQMHRL